MEPHHAVKALEIYKRAGKQVFLSLAAFFRLFSDLGTSIASTYTHLFDYVIYYDSVYATNKKFTTI